MPDIELDIIPNQHDASVEPYFALIASIKILAIKPYPLGLG